jgi:dTDP-4-amino-4,6-dideoxygalactose transaminase
LPVRTTPFPSKWPIYDKGEEQALVEALESDAWCCLDGRHVYEFEDEFAEAMGVPYATVTNGGTTALYTALQVLDIGPGDEVITPARTFIASINVIFNSHALPVFVDIDPETATADPNLIEGAITENTRAIMPIHLGGYPEDILRILSIAKKYGLYVIEDACQSVFAEVNHKKVGTFGDLGCVSFQAYKTLNSGEGGAILGTNEEFMTKCAAFVNNGRDPKKIEPGFPYPGSNHRMTEFQGSLIRQQFKRFRHQHEVRGKNGRYLEAKLQEIPGIKPRKTWPGTTRITYASLRLNYDREYFHGVPASRFAKAVRAEGIPMSGGFRRKGCNREGMVERHLNSRSFQRIYSPARLKKYRDSLALPILDSYTGEDMLSLSGRTDFLGTQKDMDDIVEAIIKISRNIDQLKTS